MWRGSLTRADDRAGAILRNEKAVNGRIGDQTIEDVFKEVFSYAWKIN
jgi:hypothetical protein